MPDEMKEYVRKGQPFTQDMRNQFVLHIISQLQLLQNQHKDIVVAQALYKEVNRSQIFQAFPEAKFIFITAPSAMITSRLKQRGKSDFAYAEQIHSLFEPPCLSHAVIENNGNAITILKQLKNILFRNS